MDSRENLMPAVETISPEAPSNYQLAPRSDNNSTLLIGPPGFSPAVSGGIPSSLVKKKRGRPRKYGPDGVVVAGGGGTLSPLPISAAGPPTSGGYSDIKFGEGEGSGGGFVAEKKKKVKINSSEAKIKNSYGSMDLGDKISSGGSFTPHMVTINPGEDVTSKIISFTKDGPRSICVLSALGVISHVTLRHASSSGGTVTYEGRFEILSLSGSFTSGEIGGRESKMSIALSSPDGRVVGGQLGGLLTAAGPVQVMVASFLPNIGSPIEPKPRKQKSILSPSSPTIARIEPRAIDMEQQQQQKFNENVQEAGNTNSTPTRSFQFENHNNTSASVHDWRRSATDMNVSLSED